MAKNKKPRLSDIIPDEKYRKTIEQGLLEGKPWIGPEGVFQELLQSVVDAALEGEMDHHMDEEKARDVNINRRNGHGKKRVKTKVGELEIHPPRDREGTFDPKLVPKRVRDISGMEGIILSMYGKGNSVEDIHRLIYEMYGVEYSTTVISTITDRVWPAILEWQQRPLQPCYVIVYLDGMHFRVKKDGQFHDRSIYTIYGVDVDGNRDVLGIYLQEVESASEWRLVLEDLSKRGVREIFFVCIDGLPGFKEIIQDTFPLAIVQRCIVHKIRNSVKYASDKERKKMCADLRLVYTAANREQAQQALEQFEQKWGEKGKRIAKLWRQDWEELMAFMDYTEHIRRMIYTTNPVEALHRIIRKVTKSKGAWISERALLKQLYLTIMESEKSWKRKAFHWKAVQADLEANFGERFTKWLIN